MKSKGEKEIRLRSHNPAILRCDSGAEHLSSRGSPGWDPLHSPPFRSSLGAPRPGFGFVLCLCGFTMSSDVSPPPLLSAEAAAQLATAPPVFTTEQILEILPHRYPFLLVDRVVEYQPGQRAVGLKNVTFNEPFFQGHFPNRPIMPGVLIVEAMAQIGGIVLTKLPDVAGRLALFAGIDGVRFRRPVLPGDQLLLSADLLTIRQRRIGKMFCRAQVGGQLVTEGELMFSLVD